MPSSIRKASGSKTASKTQFLSLPTLYSQGMEDGVNPPELSADLHKKFPGPFDGIVLQNVRHFPHREDPETVARELAIFLKA
ncbi:pimeloyl-ACP methyl ester carboxylesterase [Rhizobium sp. BK650]|uniref:alpha/beta fold hydrolase n=1 Tax=Rhizobium sp. BK650 TaxID=2586990 RepID=UPI0017CC41E4|nr:alpha/beta hydrolase [Rhizobium sp. BK650]MBB3659914.1 pimeloyl-ACP methyl ester carboxylesterase [Rhizobium sp. BK650]